MLGTSTFDKINNRLCKIFKTKKNFGGKSVNVLGECQQLRPVLNDYVFSPGKRDCNQLVKTLLWKEFQLFELTQIMRQKDDLMFAE